MAESNPTFTWGNLSDWPQWNFNNYKELQYQYPIPWFEPIKTGEQKNMAVAPPKKDVVAIPEPVVVENNIPISEKQLEHLLGQNIYAWLKISPQNELIRGHILSKTSIYVPDDVAPENIKDWLKLELAKKIRPEKEVVTPSAPSAARVLLDIANIATAPIIPTAPPIRHNFQVNLDYVQHESGSCSFSRSNALSGRVTIPNDEMLRMWEESEHNEDSFRDLIYDWVQEEERNNGYCSIDEELECDTEDFETFNTSDDDWTIATSDVVQEFFEVNNINLEPDPEPEPIIPSTIGELNDDDEETDEESGEEESEEGEDDDDEDN